MLRVLHYSPRLDSKEKGTCIGASMLMDFEKDCGRSLWNIRASL